MTNVTFELHCPACAKRLKCPPELVGRNSICPKCKSAFYISPPQAVKIAPTDEGRPEASANWKFEESTKPIDDSTVRVATVSSTTTFEIVPSLCFRTTLRDRRVTWELYLAFPEKVFSIRSEAIPAMFRVDQNPPSNLAVLPSETGNACFVAETWDLLRQMQKAQTLYCKVSMMKYGTQTFEFPVAGFSEIHQKMLMGEIAASWTELQTFSKGIVEHVLRIGPKSLDVLIDVLMRTKMLTQDQLPLAARKSLDLFSAAQAFGERHHVYEIHGALTGTTPNDPLQIAVYKNLSPQAQESAGKLFVHD